VGFMKRSYDNISDTQKYQIETFCFLILRTADLVTDWVMLVEWYIARYWGLVLVMLCLIIFPGVCITVIIRSKKVHGKTYSDWGWLDVPLSIIGIKGICLGVFVVRDGVDMGAYYSSSTFLELGMETFQSATLQTYLILTEGIPTTRTAVISASVTYIALAFKAAKSHFQQDDIQDYTVIELLLRGIAALADFLFRVVPLFLFIDLSNFWIIIAVYCFECAACASLTSRETVCNYLYPSPKSQVAIGFAYSQMVHNSLELSQYAFGQIMLVRNLEFGLRWLISAGLTAWWWWSGDRTDDDRTGIIIGILISSGSTSLILLIWLRCRYDRMSMPYATWYNAKSTVYNLLDKDYDLDYQSDLLLKFTALHIAALWGHLDLTVLFLKEGATVDINDQNNMTALMLAAGNGHLKVMKLLVGENADVDRVDIFERTALHHAAENGHFEAVNYLLGLVTDVNAVDNKGLTALNLAAEGGYLEVVKVLCEKANMEYVFNYYSKGGIAIVDKTVESDDCDYSNSGALNSSNASENHVL